MVMRFSFMMSSISSRGQITVPAEIREKLGLLPGTAVRFDLLDGGLIVRKAKGETHPVDRIYGRLNLGRRVDRLIEEMRGPPRKRSRPFQG